LTTPAAPGGRAAWRPPLLASGLAALAALIPRALTAGHFQGIDEVTWMARSGRFATALLELDPASASASTEDAATMPGITTMWLGTIAGGAWRAGRALGLIDDPKFSESAAGILLSQLAVAVATSALIGLLVLLAWRWAGGIAAVTAGALLATEPFLVANGAVLHTDELAALFGATGFLALVLALGVPGPGTDRPRLMAALAGFLLGGAFLSKLSAGVVVPGLVLVVAWALVAVARRRPSGQRIGDALRPLAVLVGIVVAAGLATTLLAWPALWADPLDQIRLLRESGGLAGEGHVQFFRGEVTETPGPIFYLVATPFRMTPWFLVGLAAMVMAAIGAATRPRLAMLAAAAIPALIILSLASKQFDRYVLVVVPFLALAVGLGLDALWRLLRPRLRSARPAAAVAAAAIGVVLAHAIWIAPWAPAYFNPLLGGAKAAEDTILIGGGEGLELAGGEIERREGPECDLTISVLRFGVQSAFPCGKLHVHGDPDSEYWVIYVNGRQRFPEEAEALRRAGRVVAEVEVEGITYAEVVDLRD
jgi:hypothetical protein